MSSLSLSQSARNLRPQLYSEEASSFKKHAESSNPYKSDSAIGSPGDKLLSKNFLTKKEDETDSISQLYKLDDSKLDLGNSYIAELSQTFPQPGCTEDQASLQHLCEMSQRRLDLVQLDIVLPRLSAGEGKLPADPLLNARPENEPAFEEAKEVNQPEPEVLQVSMDSSLKKEPEPKPIRSKLEAIAIDSPENEPSSGTKKDGSSPSKLFTIPAIPLKDITNDTALVPPPSGVSSNLASLESSRMKHQNTMLIYENLKLKRQIEALQNKLELSQLENSKLKESNLRLRQALSEAKPSSSKEASEIDSKLAQAEIDQIKTENIIQFQQITQLTSMEDQLDEQPLLLEDDQSDKLKNFLPKYLESQPEDATESAAKSMQDEIIGEYGQLDQNVSPFQVEVAAEEEKEEKASNHQQWSPENYQSSQFVPATDESAAENLGEDLIDDEVGFKSQNDLASSSKLASTQRHLDGFAPDARGIHLYNSADFVTFQGPSSGAKHKRQPSSSLENVPESPEKVSAIDMIPNAYQPTRNSSDIEGAGALKTNISLVPTIPPMSPNQMMMMARNQESIAELKYNPRPFSMPATVRSASKAAVFANGIIDELAEEEQSSDEKFLNPNRVEFGEPASPSGRESASRLEDTQFPQLRSSDGACLHRKLQYNAMPKSHEYMSNEVQQVQHQKMTTTEQFNALTDVRDELEPFIKDRQTTNEFFTEDSKEELIKYSETVQSLDPLQLLEVPTSLKLEGKHYTAEDDEPNPEGSFVEGEEALFKAPDCAQSSEEDCEENLSPSPIKMGRKTYQNTKSLKTLAECHSSTIVGTISDDEATIIKNRIQMPKQVSMFKSHFKLPPFAGPDLMERVEFSAASNEHSQQKQARFSNKQYHQQSCPQLFHPPSSISKRHFTSHEDAKAPVSSFFVGDGDFYPRVSPHAMKTISQKK